MEKYDEYKDSGIEWIGDIPGHWLILRLRLVCELRNGYTPSKDNPDFWEDGNIPWYRMEDIRESGRKLNVAKQYITKQAVKGGGLFKAGSFIMATTATIGEHAVLIVDSLANQRFTNFQIRKSLENNMSNEYFFNYLFVVDEYCKSTTRTATFPAVNMEDLRNFPVLFPSLEEQHAIVAYIEQETSKIDKHIEKSTRRIELLQELKQTIITRAVTRGINPDVKLKDSGVEWIGQIPEHWEIMKIRWAYPNLGSGTTPDTNNPLYYVDDGYNWLQTGDLTDGIITSTSKHLSRIAVSEKKMRFYPIGSIVIAMYGATIGKVGLLQIETSTNQACCVLPPQKNIDNRFMLFVLKSSRDTLISKSIGGGQPNISQAIIQDHRIPFPALDEQQAIACYLETKCERINSSISTAVRQIQLLKEYKQSLITEVVTGKRKVI